MIKRLPLLLLGFCLCLLLFGCGNEQQEMSNVDSTVDENTAVFTNKAAIDALDAHWFFVPNNASNIKTKEYITKLEASFDGCIYEEINDYAVHIQAALKEHGFALYQATLGDSGLINGLVEADDVSKEIKDEYFTGTAYTFIIEKDAKYFTVTVKYYGSAGGARGNGRCVITIEDKTENFKPYGKETEQ